MSRSTINKQKEWEWDHPCELQDTNKRNYLGTTIDPKGDESGGKVRKLKEIIAENFPNLRKKIRHPNSILNDLLQDTLK